MVESWWLRSTAACSSCLQVPGDAVRIVSHSSPGADETCLQDVTLHGNAAGAELVGDRLALRVFYSANSRNAVALHVETTDPERPYRDLQLHPVNRRAELVDLGSLPNTRH